MNFLVGMTVRNALGRAFEYVHFAATATRKLAGAGAIGAVQEVPTMMMRQGIPTTVEEGKAFLTRNIDAMGEGGLSLMILQALTGAKGFRLPDGKPLTFNETRALLAEKRAMQRQMEAQKPGA